MVIKKISEINHYSGTTINPLQSQNEMYELYSVPSFANQYPEIVRGSELGSSKIVVEENDVLICKINPRINRVWVVKHHTNHQLIASSEWIVIRNHKINSEYLKWYFSSPSFRSLLNSQVAGIGGSLTRAQPKQVANYPVPIYSEREQHQIAAVLDKVTNLISLRNQQLSKLDELVKSRFIEMFGDPVSNCMKWDTAQLSELGELSRGVSKNRPRNSPDLIGGQHPLVQTSEVSKSGVFIYHYDSSYSDKGLAQSRMWPKGTLLITIAANIAQTGILTFDSCFPDSVVGFLSGEKTRQVFIHYWFSFFQKILEKQAPQVAQKNINLKILSELKVIVPPIDRQDRFVTFVGQVEQLRDKILKNLDIFETMKKMLMYQYFK